MYTYYKEVKVEEHMLYAGEIANLFKIETINGLPATNLVSAVLKEYIETLDDYEQVFYINSHGYKNKVYPASIYGEAMAAFMTCVINKYPNEDLYLDNEKIFELKIADKNYKFRLYREI